MGQTRPVTVRYLTVQDSIETNIVKLVQQRTTGTLAEKNDGENDGRPEIIDIEEEEENMRRAQMNKGELAGAIRADKQKLKLEGLIFSFREAICFQSFHLRMKFHARNPLQRWWLKMNRWKTRDLELLEEWGSRATMVIITTTTTTISKTSRKDSQENKDIGSEENRQPLAKVQKRASLSETVQNAVGSMLEKFM